ncbi:Bulb-type lectin domain [Dillenia turbinata]|uniref:non-specific serine/threonine protein kinase n=1 Tax=Dillenia turbinata TaxID=194707 RepID=A0AAN8UXV0_9MAGN
MGSGEVILHLVAQKEEEKIIIGTTVGAASVFVCLSIYLVWKRKLLPNKWKPEKIRRGLPERSQDFLLNGFVIPNKRDYSDERATDDLELPLFDFGTLVKATNNFSDTNKLGQGGFGCVYKGMLIEGQEIAVKRLSKNSGQGVEEFKNEVKLIARLQHRNLVRLLGCCVEMEEKMLVYEYMPNKSLDSILFRKERSSVLDWRRRFNIICGIARGLLYLHQDSRFRIIHRDLKASNILLDADLNPRISDFGMARIFGSDQTEASTKRVVGTYGYMSPEYAMDGLFSDKSDVFSFGVLVMEIVSGKKNRGFYCADNHLNLLGFAWNLWREQKALELVDSSIGEKYPACEALRCIQVGLLCVQEHAEDRPTMSTVVLLLSSETTSLPQPKNPGFGLGRTNTETDSIWIQPEDESCTVNQSSTLIIFLEINVMKSLGFRPSSVRARRNGLGLLILQYDIVKQPGLVCSLLGQENSSMFSRFVSPMKGAPCFTILSVTFFLIVSFNFSSAIDSISFNQSLYDINNDTLVSANSTFELGFFSPWNSRDRYVGIWFKNIAQQTIVWVANRNAPLTDSSGVLGLTRNGNIIIRNNRSLTPIWSSDTSSRTTNNPVLQLLGTGNLVLEDADNPGNYIWQSFDYPFDTLLPQMKLGWNLQTNKTWFLTSWNSLQDPSPGQYTCKMDPHGLPQLMLQRGSTEIYRSGPWNGIQFGGSPPIQQNTVYEPIFIYNSDYVFYTFQNIDNSIISRFVVNQTGLIQHLAWNQQRGDWFAVVTLQADQCDQYDYCGPNGICNSSNKPYCQCLKGFVPEQQSEWNKHDYRSGCVRRKPLNCTTGKDGFQKFSGVKLPDNTYLVSRTVQSLVECEEACLSNCSCVAYANTDFSGCVLWYGDLLDIRVYTQGGEDLYVRLAASELGSSKKKRVAAIAASSAFLGLVLISLISWFVVRRRRSRRVANARRSVEETVLQLSQETPNTTPDHGQIKRTTTEEDLELPSFDFDSVTIATNNFSWTNKIGQGGFGSVYKGVLPTGQEIAVKRLSKDSGQGIQEFKNEVILISKLQHRNLVKLLGCCIEGEERMLIYEYMPNKSLDVFIFDNKNGAPLDWDTRFDIIVGIARGLLYLHRDSRLRIVHRDLKASNILLDNEMNPKISDFGLARTFGGDQAEGSTNRVVGTYGYMSPEYAIDGFFSLKSDVFSFGVLVLEILSGKKNRGFYHSDHDLNLLGHAWRLWNDGKQIELLDKSVRDPIPEFELVRCIHVGLLCVQQHPEDRPTMDSVLLMLGTAAVALPEPKQPGFYTERFLESDSSSTKKKVIAESQLTISMLHGR